MEVFYCNTYCIINFNNVSWYSCITCSAVALSRVLRTALVPYGNMETSTPHSSKTPQVITMKLCTFEYVCETNTCAKFGWNLPARVAPCIPEIYKYDMLSTQSTLH